MRHIHSQPSLILDAPSGAGLPWPAERTICFGSGRESLVSLCRALAPRGRPVALVPAFVPEGVFAPFKACGWDVRLYPLDRDLDPDWGAFEALLDQSRAGVAVLIHYFGLAKPSARFKQLCEARDVVAIDDLSHVAPETRTADVHGDVVLYSLPKVLGVPDGAPLVLRDRRLIDSDLRLDPHPLRHVVTAGRMAIVLGGTLVRSGAMLGQGRLVRGMLGMAIDPYPLHMRIFHRPGPMSAMTRAILRRTDFDRQADIRRRHARRYDAGLSRTAFQRFRTTAPGEWAGIGFPVRVRGRAALARHLRSAGIQGAWYETRWNFIPEADRHRHEESIRAMKEHFLFPVAPALTDTDVDHVIESANGWAREYSPAT